MTSGGKTEEFGSLAGLHVAEEADLSSPPRRCVSCGTTSNCKLLACLHTCCLHCLRENLLDSGKVACPSTGCGETTSLPASGRGLEALPNDHLATRASLMAGSLVCDECLEEAPAVQRCDDCRLLLCDFHTQAHRKGRQTHLHHLSGDAETWFKPLPVLCSLHRSFPVQQYCQKCQQLLCERCIIMGTHVGHSADITTLEEAGMAIRCRLAKRAQNTTDGSAKKLEQALRIVSRSITEVNESAEEHSLAIEKKKKEFLRLLEEDEKQNIESIDSQRWGKLKILERHEQGLKESVAMTSRAIELVTESSMRLTDAELLEMSVALEDGLSKADSEGLECHAPKVSSAIHHTQSWDRIAPTSPPASVFDLGLPTVQESQSKGMHDSAYPFHFDSTFCGANIELSSSYRTVTSTDPHATGGSAVLGSIFYRRSRLAFGKVQWRILIERLSPLHSSAIHIGVTDIDDTLANLSSKDAWVWSSQKHRGQWLKNWKTVGGMPEWKEGDVLTLVVDCTAKPPALILRIGNEESRSWSFDMAGFNGVFWPFFYVNCGQKITLLPC